MPNKPLPILMSCPHAGLDVPPEVQNQLAISSVDLYNDADLWADQHYDFCHPDLVDLVPPGHSPGVLEMVSMPIARALIDPNRPPDSLDNPDGAVKQTTSYGRAIYHTPLSRACQTELLNRYWHRYHGQLEEAMARHAGQVRLFLDCHSMAQHGPSAYANPGLPRPLLCLANGGDRRGERMDERPLTCPPWLIRAAGEIGEELFGDLSLLQPAPGADVPVVGLNWPFGGGYIVRRYTDPAVVTHAPPGMMVEVNRGLLVGDQSADTPMVPPNAERIRLVRRRLYQWATRLVDLLDHT